MNGKIVAASAVPPERLDWGTRRWLSRPSLTDADLLLLVEVTLEPGFGHAFHKHPEQEEIVYVLDGEIEQWIETERSLLRAGDSAFIKKGIVHASFNVSSGTARLLAIVGPCRGVGDDGYDVVEVADQPPWSALRAPLPRA